MRGGVARHALPTTSGGRFKQTGGPGQFSRKIRYGERGSLPLPTKGLGSFWGFDGSNSKSVISGYSGPQILRRGH